MAHPFTDLSVIFQLVTSTCPRWWAVVAVVFTLLPTLVLLILLNDDDRTRKSFIRAFQLRPTICALAYLNIALTWKRLWGRTSVTLPEEALYKLRRSLTLLALSLGVCFRFTLPSRRTRFTNVCLLLANIALAFYGQYKNYSSFATYTRILTGGNKKDFFNTLLQMGQKTASPHLMTLVRSKSRH